MKKNLGGFTIIEVLAAIFVLTVGMIGVLTVIQQTMAQIETLNERLIAIYFAQEGIEIVRNIRDGNWLAETTWDNNLGVGNWEADYLAQDLSSWVEPGSYLRIDGGFYNYSSGTSTSFKREIIISDKLNLDGIAGDDQMKVTVTVYWEAKGEHQISAQEFLYNWRY
ncbi:prepilin-type N-terminal cleavage/methylation domain-containing protein [Patescibacteria group bacterium]|nr:prepilin-type N-terminal cleavage/methylation domain-containing protein [Patescibacteria group bacterium]